MASLVVVLSFHSGELKSDFLQTYVKAAKYEANVNRAVGIAQSARVQAAMVVAIADWPFVISREEALETDRFLSLLKTRVEKA
jgi:hypothetical protein